MEKHDKNTNKQPENEKIILNNPETDKFTKIVYFLNHKSDETDEIIERDEKKIKSRNSNETGTKYNMQNRNQPLKYLS